MPAVRSVGQVAAVSVVLAASFALNGPPAQISSEDETLDVHRDVTYGSADGVTLLMDVYRPPAGAEPYPAVVVVHGGGWYTGDKSDADVVNASRVLADAGYVVFNINYRLAPEFPFPAAQQHRGLRRPLRP